MGCEGDHMYVKAPSDMWVSPTMSDFGNVPVGSIQTQAFQLEVSIGTSVQLEGLTLENTSPDGTTHTYCKVMTELSAVSTDEPFYVDVEYAPLSPGYHRCVLTIESNAQTPEHVVELRGHAIEGSVARYPAMLDFGPVELGRNRTEQVFVKNETSAPFSVTEAIPSDSAFFIASTFPLTIAPYSEQGISISFIPYDENPIQAELFIQSDASVQIPSVVLQANDCENGTASLYDQDGDGIKICADDCDDNDPNISPFQVEVCDEVDNNCNDIIDENTNCYDDDGDGFSEDDGDCNDNNPDVHPDQNEIFTNGIDDNCDGIMDPSESDQDGDGMSASAGDCNDNEATIFMGHTEIQDGLDNDCDGIVDENTNGYDDDGDGFSEDGGDCFDNLPTSYPGATEVSDGIDNDCDGIVDENTDEYDDDGDGFTENGGDCNDNNPNINPAEQEIIGDSVDNNCDGTIE